MGPPTNPWSEGFRFSCGTKDASPEGTTVKLRSIILGKCGTLGLDLRRVGNSAAAVVVVVVGCGVGVVVVVAVVVGTVTSEFISLVNIR